MAALRLEGAAWGGAPVVDQDGAALGEHGLLKIVLRHGPPGAGKIIPDALGRGLVEHQLLSKRLGQHVFRQVITGGAQPPVVMMISARPLAAATASRARWGLSPTTVCQ